MSNELTIENPHFAIVEKVTWDNLKDLLHYKLILKKLNHSKKLNSKSSRFIEYCIMYLRFFYTMFCIVNTLHNCTSNDNSSSHKDTTTSNAYYYGNEII